MKHLKLIIPTLILIILISTLVYINTLKEMNTVEVSDIANTSTIAFYIQDESGDYTISSTIPEKGTGYAFSSYSCDGDATVTFSNSTWTLYISNMSASETKCKLYFDITTTPAKDYILSNITTISERTDFSVAVTDETTGVIYTAEDNDGTSYYYAGASTDNYVYFANYYWRIIRINGDGSIRLIYDGTSAYSNGTSSTDRRLDTTTFNSSNSDNAYLGYMYTLNSLHGIGTSSTMKEYLEDWYYDNLLDYASYISDSGFCGDRTPSTSASTSSSSGGTGTTTTYYGTYLRITANKSPSLKCYNSSDFYTVTETDGNQSLEYPIGLIIGDEIAFAGGLVSATNTSYYLYIGSAFYSMSPSYFNYSSGYAAIYYVGSNGNLHNGFYVTASLGAKPVINLSKDVTLRGEGTSSSPYTVS